MPKPFSPSLFLEHDKIAKIKALEYYKSKGILLKTNEDVYGVDLIGDEVNVEVEHKACWTNGQLSPVFIFARKGKMKTGKTEFFLLNNNFTKAMIIKEISLNEDRLVLQSNKYIENEAAYRIPLNEIEYVDLIKT